MKLAVFNYHYIRPEFPKHGIHGVTPEEFKKQLLYIKFMGYSFISLDFLNSMILSHKTFNRKYCLITFDDGLKEQLTYGLPILKGLNIPAVFFVPRFKSYIHCEPCLNHVVHYIISEIEKEPEGIKLYNKERKLAEKHYPYDQKSTAHFKYFWNFLIDDKRRAEMMCIYYDKIKGLYMNRMDVDHSIKESSKYYFGSHMDMRREKIFGYHSQDSISYHNGFLPTQKQLLQLIRLKYISGFTIKRGFNYDLKQPFFIKRFDANNVYEVL